MYKVFNLHKTFTDYMPNVSAGYEGFSDSIAFFS